MTTTSKLTVNNSEHNKIANVKSVVTGLEKLKVAVNAEREDKDELRNLSHKLLRLVNAGDDAHKAEVSTKGSLSVILQILENCTDQATILALVGALTEVAKAGGAPAKRLTAHDTTRTLLQILAAQGDKFSYRTLLAVISLLSKIAGRDKKFGLRTRLTGALAPLLSSVRSSYNHTGHQRLLGLSLNVIRLSLLSSPTNATVLGRHGGISILYKVITHLERKQQTPLKNVLTIFNIMVKNSKLNASRAVGLGVVSLMLTMHQDYHRLDFRHERNLITRKSILNILKNVLSPKSGIIAFTEADGLKILIRSCKDYLRYVTPSKNTIALMNVATLIMTRCQPKEQLPVDANVCSFSFDLAGVRDNADNLSLASAAASEDFDGHVLVDSDEDDDLDDLGGSGDDRKAKKAGGADSDGDDDDGKVDDTVNFDLPVTRMYEDLKMYERFFLELTDFPIDHIERARLSTSEQIGSKGRDANTKSVKEVKAMPKTSLPNFANQKHEHTKGKKIKEEPSAPAFDVDKALGRAAVKSSASHHDQRLDATSSKLKTKMHMARLGCSALSLFKTFVPMPEPGTPSPRRKKKTHHHDDKPSKESTSTLSMANEINVTKLQLLEMQRAYRSKIALIASKTTSIKGGINRLSLADEHLLQPCQKLEPLLSTKLINRNIRLRIINNMRRLINSNKYPLTMVYDTKPGSDADKGLADGKPTTPSRRRSSVGSKLPNQRTSRMEVAEKPPLTIPTGLQMMAEQSRKDSVCSTASGYDMVEDYSLDKSRLPSYIYRNYQNPYGLSMDDNHYGNMSFDSSNNSNGSSSLLEQIVVNSGDSETLSSEDGADGGPPPLHFNSDFESGNLRSAMRIGKFEYELVINADCNTHHHFQWFYFEIAGMLVEQPYVFNIINCEKDGSSFNEGMQPVMFSAIEARRGQPAWRRVGRDVCYYRNHYVRRGGQADRCYFTATFTVNFQYEGDICYIAYHYPYTYSKLQMDLDTMISQADHTKIFVHRQVLCQTLSGNDVPMLTITAMPSKAEGKRSAKEELKSRPYIFLTARVHPGETNASWTMRGTLQILLTCQAKGEEATPLTILAEDLRKSYIFKIVPMLNPDGVINGCHRCSLSGNDLNRTWIDPNPLMHPTIFHTKGLLQYMYSIQKTPMVYCDYHGHSRKMNVFMYGCNIQDSIDYGEAQSVLGAPDDSGGKMIPRILQYLAPTFALKNCSWVVDRGKVATARVVVWKEFGVQRSYTMESTYSGCDQGEYRGKQLNISLMEIMGSQFCECLMMLKDRNDKRALPTLLEDEQSKQVSSTNPGDVVSAIKAIPITINSELDVDADSLSPPLISPVNSDAELTPDENSFSPSEYNDTEDNTSDVNSPYFCAQVVSSHLVFQVPFTEEKSGSSGHKGVELNPLSINDFAIPSDLPHFQHGLHKEPKKVITGKKILPAATTSLLANNQASETSVKARPLTTTTILPEFTNQLQNSDHSASTRSKSRLQGRRTSSKSSNSNSGSEKKVDYKVKHVNKKQDDRQAGTSSFPRPFESSKRRIVTQTTLNREINDAKQLHTKR